MGRAAPEHSKGPWGSALGFAPKDFEAQGHGYFWASGCYLPSSIPDGTHLTHCQSPSMGQLVMGGPTAMNTFFLSTCPTDLSHTCRRPYADSDTDSTPSYDSLLSSRMDTWRLVWCHERCHKQECGTIRQALNRASPHAPVTCLKKADKFAAWVQECWRLPYVLLTDWREAKPCHQTLLDQPPACQPLLTIVLVENAKQFERASVWSSSSKRAREGPGGDVYVFQEAWEVKDFLDSHMPMLFDHQKLRRPSIPRSQRSSLSLHPAEWCTSHEHQSPIHHVPLTTCHQDASVGTEILSPLWQSHSVGQLVELLKSTQPEHYDD